MPDPSSPRTEPSPWPVCPSPVQDDAIIDLAHGGGGYRTHQLISSVFLEAFGDPLQTSGHDSAVFDASSPQLAFTTDSYVVQPIEFPGGNIGSMSVHGTVNDLLMAGARPRYLSAGFILEAGLEIRVLKRIADAMRIAADEAGVQIVTGDTKVIGRGRGDGLFINTTGIGSIIADQPIGPAHVSPDADVILSGDIGRHGIAVMSAREQLDLGNTILSDSACLCPAVLPLLNHRLPILCMRDLTRGGLATALVEIAQTSRNDIEIDEQHIPISDPVRGACELLGLDPLYVANEGRFIIIIPKSHTQQALSLLHANESTRQAKVIGRVRTGKGRVAMKTLIGTSRAIAMISGEQLPRIC